MAKAQITVGFWEINDKPKALNYLTMMMIWIWTIWNVTRP